MSTYLLAYIPIYDPIAATANVGKTKNVKVK